jgi:hypothetical protein
MLIILGIHSHLNILMELLIEQIKELCNNENLTWNVYIYRIQCEQAWSMWELHNEINSSSNNIIWNSVIITTSKFVIECLSFPINKQLYVGAYKCHMWANHYDKPIKTWPFFQYIKMWHPWLNYVNTHGISDEKWHK